MRPPGARTAALAVLSPVIRRAGHAYLAGTTSVDAVAAGRRLMAGGHALTLGYWNDPTDTPADVLAQTLACVTALSTAGAGAQVAVKAPALDFQVEAARQIGRAAAAAGVELLFDAHAANQADDTFALALTARAEGASTGVALPARWGRSVADAGAAAAAGLSVRVVKGQFPDVGEGRGTPSEAGSRRSYLHLVDRLTNLTAPVSIATHDAVLVEAAVRRLAVAGRSCAVELLLGLPAKRPLAVAGRHQVPVRFYVPYGHPSLSYSLSSVFRRPRLAGNLVQGVLLGAVNRPVRLREALQGCGPGSVPLRPSAG